MFASLNLGTDRLLRPGRGVGGGGLDGVQFSKGLNFGASILKMQCFGLERVPDGEVHFKNCYWQGGVLFL